jgi:hypothetical protein
MRISLPAVARLAPVLLAPVLVCALAPSAARAADTAPLFDVGNPQVLPVLANYPYDPVLVGPHANEPGLFPAGDPDDCTFTRGGAEDRTFGGDRVGLVRGCGAVRLQADAVPTGPGAPALYGMQATATVDYGCVNVHNGRVRTVATRTDVIGADRSSLEIPIADPSLARSRLNGAAMLPRQDVVCRKAEQPAQLRVRVTDFVVTVTAAFGSGATEVHALPGSWSAELALPPRHARP